MNKVSNFKYWIVSFSIISILCLVIGYTTYYFLEQNRLIKEAYPYPALYDAVKKECPALLKGNEYVNKTTRDNGSLISGVTEFRYQGKNQKVDIRIVRNNIMIYFVKMESLEKEGDFEITDYETTIFFNNSDNQFQKSPIDIPEVDLKLKKAFEQEMIERLKSC